MLENIVESSVNRRDFLRLIVASSVFGCGGDGITSNGFTNPIDLENNGADSETFNIFDYLPLEKDNGWIYEVDNSNFRNVESVLSVEEEGDKKIIQMMGLLPGGIRTYYIQDGLFLLYSTNDGGTFFDPPIIKGGSSMRIGDRLTTNYDFYMMFGRNSRDVGDGVSTFTLLSLEDVRVPAGRFKNCLKIEESQSEVLFGGLLDSNGPLVATSWFAKGVGKVKMDFRVSTEYHEFKLVDHYRA